MIGCTEMATWLITVDEAQNGSMASDLLIFDEMVWSRAINFLLCCLILFWLDGTCTWKFCHEEFVYGYLIVIVTLGTYSAGGYCHCLCHPSVHLNDVTMISQKELPAASQNLCHYYASELFQC